MTSLTITPAGAGAGKTWRIKETLGAWVKAGVVRPERILAVTFTEAAAGELRQRIRAQLIADGDPEAAVAVERAYVSTIHGLGLRLLGEHAFAAGAAPVQRLISEAEQDLLIRREIARCEALTPVAERLAAHGYGWDPRSGRTAEDAFRRRVVSVVDRVRELGARGADPGLADLAADAISAAYPDPATPSIGDPAVLAADLIAAVNALLDRFPRSLAGAAPNATAIKAFRENFALLTRVARRPDDLETDWALWNRLRTLRLSMRGAPTPEGYDALAGAVMVRAEGLLRHPGPRDDAMTHARALIAGAQAIVAGYGRRKRELGVIDYADMVAEAARLLDERPEILDAVVGEIDCVIVDEFQDTNPVQFALVWALSRRARLSLLVGDSKQAIMGFQGADPRLTSALVRAHTDSLDPLTHNWRSVPAIMDLVNALGPRLFPGGDYQALAPTRPAGPSPPLEVLEIHAARAARGDKARPQHGVADHIRALLSDGAQVVDRHTGTARAMVPGDIAILCPTHNNGRAYAQALRELAIPVRVDQRGWWQTGPVQAAVHALALAMDPSDRHAALCFATLGPPSTPLEGALSALVAGTALTNAAQTRLEALNPRIVGQPVDAAVHAVLKAGGFWDWCETLADPAQARADLLRLEAEAEAFVEAHPDMRAAAGFHGGDPRVFIGWLQALTADEEANRRPNPFGRTADGVEVVTWHGCKGREWPVVVVAGLDHDLGPRAGEIRTEYDDFSSLDHILDQATLRFTPVFTAKETQARFLDPLLPEADLNRRRLVYVALTRARDRLIIEWPAKYLAARLKALAKDPGKRPPMNAALLLHDEGGFALEPDGVRAAGARFPARIRTYDDERPDTPPWSDTAAAAGTRLTVGRRAIRRVAVADDDGSDRVYAPSQAEAAVLPLPHGVVHHALADGVTVADAAFAAVTERGTAVHEALRVLLLAPGAVERAARHTGLDAAAVQALSFQADALRARLAADGFHTLHVEQPVRVDLPDGGSLTAIVDLIAESDDALAVIDHKSDAVTDLDVRFAVYWPQLSAYVELVGRRPGVTKPVTQAGILWTRRGVLSLARLWPPHQSRDG